MDGIICLDKPQNMTSFSCCAAVRRLLGGAKIGHAGTLDPMATGVLPVFVGRATRAVEFFESAEKEYIAGLRLGTVTTTQDTTGEVVERRPVQLSPGDLEQALIPFRGNIEQVPPMYSAVKINGKKLYELARKGREVERRPRPVTIHSLTLEGQEGQDRFLLRIRCSKGTYVRTLCHDIGQVLGCGGAMYSLRRTMAAGFTLADALSLEQVQQTEDPSALLLPVDAYFAGRPVLTLQPEAEKKVRNGMTLVMPEAPPGEYRVYGPNGDFLALSRAGGGKLTTIKSFFDV